MRIVLTLDRDEDPSEENDYVRSLVEAGVPREAIAVVTPASPRMPETFDGLVLGGGGDVDPARFGSRARPDARLEVDPERDAVDFALLDRARESGAPVLGICRGLQVINVALGGTLVQDIPSQRPSPYVHARGREEKTRRDHPVSIEPGTRFAKIAAAPEIAVNSRHHQAIDRAAPGLVASAIAPDGLVEGVEASHGGWLVAVQWHPENLSGDPVSRRLFEDFVRAVRERETLSWRPER